MNVFYNFLGGGALGPARMSYLKQSRGFTLIELMIVVTIIGSLATIAVPNFTEYKDRAKIAEAYVLVSAMQKGMQAHFTLNKTFVTTFDHPANYPTNGAKATFDEPTNNSKNSAWKALGTPITYGAPVYFTYSSMSGHIDATGTRRSYAPGGYLNASDNYGATLYFRKNGSQTCYVNGQEPDDFGASGDNGSHWALLSAAAELSSGSDKCVIIFQMMETDGETTRKTSLIKLKAPVETMMAPG